MNLIFVYGTLQRGEANHARLGDATFLGPAETAPGFALYSLGDFPGLVAEAGGAGTVTGEVWSVRPATLAALDVFEGVAAGLYARVPVPLAPPFAAPRVEAYCYRRSIAGRERLGRRWRPA